MNTSDSVLRTHEAQAVFYVLWVRCTNRPVAVPCLQIVIQCSVPNSRPHPGHHHRRCCRRSHNGPLFATCQVGNVAGNGGQATASVVVYPTNVGNLFVTADAADSTNDTATIQGGSTLTGVGIADVAVFLSTTPNPAQVGAPLTYGGHLGERQGRAHGGEWQQSLQHHGAAHRVGLDLRYFAAPRRERGGSERAGQ